MKLYVYGYIRNTGNISLYEYEVWRETESKYYYGTVYEIEKEKVDSAIIYCNCIILSERNDTYVQNLFGDMIAKQCHDQIKELREREDEIYEDFHIKFNNILKPITKIIK